LPTENLTAASAFYDPVSHDLTAVIDFETTAFSPGCNRATEVAIVSA
jgi:hypothetical protein